MYLPRHFEELRPDRLHAFIADHPLGALVVNGPHGLDANHLPFLIDVGSDGKVRLLAHVARANPVWHEVEDGSNVLVIFRADGAYISPNWYPTKAETHRAVPTWNYQVVHAHGTFHVHDDEKFLRGVVGRLTRHHEGRADAQHPWKMGDSPRDYIEQMIASVVGISVLVTSMTGKWKLGQNRAEVDRIGAADALERQGDGATARAMRTALDGVS